MEKFHVTTVYKTKDGTVSNPTSTAVSDIDDGYVKLYKKASDLLADATVVQVSVGLYDEAQNQLEKIFRVKEVTE